MGLVMEITRIVLPLVIVGGIGVFVVRRLNHKYIQGNLGREKSKGTQDILDSLIPLGMLFGCTIGVVFSMFFSISVLSTVSLGTGIGLLAGYISYEIYSKKGTGLC